MSKTKRNISDEALNEIFSKHSLGKIVKVIPLKGGQFNSVLKITVQSGKNYVIKIAPSKGTDVLTYEKDLIKSEVYFYEKFSSLKNIHFPEIYGYDYDRESEYQYLVMEFIEGKTLTDAKLSKEDYDQVMYELGCAMAEIHNLSCEEGFGYIQNGLFASWEEAYLNMTENVIKNAERKNAEIPRIDEIRHILLENRDLLKSVKKPCPVHFDLWAGNIMLKDKKLYALIDCERAMFGDRIGDFISLDYISPFDKKKNELISYRCTSQYGAILLYDSKIIRKYICFRRERSRYNANDQFCKEEDKPKHLQIYWEKLIGNKGQNGKGKA